MCDHGGMAITSSRRISGSRRVLDRDLLARLDAERQPVLGRRQRTGVLRRVGAPRVVGEVEVEGVRAVVLGLEVEVAAGAVRLASRRRVAERDEQLLDRAGLERVADERAPCRPARSKSSVPTRQASRVLPSEVTISVVLRGVGVGRQRQALDPIAGIGREVAQAGVVMTLLVRDRRLVRATGRSRPCRAGSRAPGPRTRPRGGDARGSSWSWPCVVVAVACSWSCP